MVLADAWSGDNGYRGRRSLCSVRAHSGPAGSPRVGTRPFRVAGADGSAIAVLTIVSDVHSPAAAARGVATLHVPFPASLPFYAYGAIVLTVLFHFLPLALALALLRATALDRTWIPPAVVVVVLALSEDWNYLAQVGLRASVETARHVLSFAANLLELWFIQRFGLLAGLCQRLTTYAWWHVVWGALTK